MRTFLRKHEQNILRDIMKVQHWGPGLALASKVDIKQPSQKATVTFGDASVSFGLSAAAALTQLYASCSAHQWRHALVYVASYDEPFRNVIGNGNTIHESVDDQ